MKRVKTVLSDRHYQLMAHLIRTIPDEAARQIAADHFATELNRRSPFFDPYRWHQATGGKVAPNSAATGYDKGAAR